uniref:Uncharacterized protein n=1 Tax=Anguilla anguilla TaxID=7936 RepID=A0A0E9SEK6_ANGAN
MQVLLFQSKHIFFNYFFIITAIASNSFVLCNCKYSTADHCMRCLNLNSVKCELQWSWPVIEQTHALANTMFEQSFVHNRDTSWVRMSK